jgi:hypothetical protein
MAVCEDTEYAYDLVTRKLFTHTLGVLFAYWPQLGDFFSVLNVYWKKPSKWNFHFIFVIGIIGICFYLLLTSIITDGIFLAISVNKSQGTMHEESCHVVTPQDQVIKIIYITIIFKVSTQRE